MNCATLLGTFTTDGGPAARSSARLAAWAMARRRALAKGIPMEPLLGQLILVPYNFAPKGWLPCDGRTLPIMQNQALFSLLGTNFGGDGKSTFGLPSLKAPAANLQYVIAIAGIYPSRE